MVLKDTESDMKAKRIVYQMSQELERCSVEDDFQKVVLGTRMKPEDLEVGYSSFLELHQEIRDSLKHFNSFGEKDGLLKFLTGKQMKDVRQMLNKSAPGGSETRKTNERGSVRVLENEEGGIGLKVFDIPQLHFGDQFHRSGEEEDDEEIECVSGQPRLSSRELPTEPIPSFHSNSRSHVEKPIPPRVLEVYDVPEPTPPPKPILKNKIVSRPRPVEKSDQGMQTDEVPVEVPVKVDMADQGTSCDLLTDPSPSFEPTEAVNEEDVESEDHSSPILSPISTVTSELSEGEVRPNSIVRADVISVRTDGSILEDPYFGESESDILRATSSSPLRVAEMDMSVSSTPTRSQ